MGKAEIMRERKVEMSSRKKNSVRAAPSDQFPSVAFNIQASITYTQQHNMILKYSSLFVNMCY